MNRIDSARGKNFFLFRYSWDHKSFTLQAHVKLISKVNAERTRIKMSVAHSFFHWEKVNILFVIAAIANFRFFIHLWTEKESNLYLLLSVCSPVELSVQVAPAVPPAGAVHYYDMMLP